MGVVTRLISMGSLTVFGFLKGSQPIADMISAAAAACMAIPLHRSLDKI